MHINTKCCREINLPAKGTFRRIRILGSKHLTSDFLHVHNSKATETLRLSIHTKELRENILSPMNVLLSSRRVPPVHNVELDTALVTQSTGDDLTLWCGNRLHPYSVSICARKGEKMIQERKCSRQMDSYSMKNPHEANPRNRQHSHQR